MDGTGDGVTVGTAVGEMVGVIVETNVGVTNGVIVSKMIMSGGCVAVTTAVVIGTTGIFAVCTCITRKTAVKRKNSPETAKMDASMFFVCLFIVALCCQRPLVKSFYSPLLAVRMETLHAAKIHQLLLYY